MDIKTYASTLVLTLLMTLPAVMAMDESDLEKLSPQKTISVQKNVSPTTSEPSRSLGSTGGCLGASSAEQLPSSSALPPSPASDDQNLPSTTPFTRLVQVSLTKASGTKVTEGAVVTNSNGIVTVTSDNTTQHTYQVATNRFPVKSGEYVEVTCDVFAEVGKIIKLGLLNSKGDNWYPYHNEYPQRILLKKGRQTARFIAVVPEGECETSLIFYNDRVTDDSPQFTIRSLKIGVHKAAPPRTLLSRVTFGYLGANSAEQLPGSSVLVPSPASSSDDQSPLSTTPLTRLVQVSLTKALGTKVTEGAVVVNNNGIVTVTSDNTTQHTYQVATNRFPVKSGEYVEVTCDVFADIGKIIKLGLLNSKGDNWYPYHNEYPQQVLLEKGRQTAKFIAVVPEGECETSLIFYNDRITDDSPQFTIRSLKIGVHKAAPPRTLLSRATWGYFD